MSGLSLNEIFYSIQGETSLVGRPAVFIRLAGCNMRCAWCDTSYAWEEGEHTDIDNICHSVMNYPTGIAVITGGEPLIQKDTVSLAERLSESGWKVLVETNGSMDISMLPATAVIIMDMKPPSSGETENIFWKKEGLSLYN